MKKITMLALVLHMMITGLAYAHVAKSETKKDDNILKLDKTVKQLIIEKQDFDQALKCLAQAARKNTDQPYYKEQYAILRRVIKMNRIYESKKNEKDLKEAELKNILSYYKAIRAYYYAKGYYALALPLDEDAYKIFQQEELMINYLESLAIQSKKKQAYDLLDSLEPAVLVKPEIEILSLYVHSKTNPAKSIKKMELPTYETLTPNSMVYLAAVSKTAENTDTMKEYLVKALENTPPTQIETTKQLIMTLSEFSDLQQNDQFKEIMATESNVYQSGCTGGSSCNSCSLKGSCPSTK